MKRENSGTGVVDEKGTTTVLESFEFFPFGIREPPADGGFVLIHGTAIARFKLIYRENILT